MSENHKNILVVLDAAGCAPGSIHMATELAAWMQASIQALYVEDNNILNVVDLPFTREVSLNTAKVEGIDSSRLIRKFQEEAKSLKKQINEIAVTRQVSISFSSKRGHKMHVIKDSTQEVEVVLMPAVTQRRSRQQQHAQMNKVIVVFDKIDASCDKALNVALSYATNKGNQLVVIVNDDQSKQYVEKSISQQAELVECEVVDIFDMDKVFMLFYRYSPGLFVLPQSSRLIEDEQLLQRLVNLTESDVLIVR